MQRVTLYAGQSRSKRSVESLETTPCQGGCEVILKIFLLASIKFFQKFIEIMLFLFELCRNHLQAIKSYRLPERKKKSVLLYCS